MSFNERLLINKYSKAPSLVISIQNYQREKNTPFQGNSLINEDDMYQMVSLYFVSNIMIKHIFLNIIAFGTNFLTQDAQNNIICICLLRILSIITVFYLFFK